MEKLNKDNFQNSLTNFIIDKYENSDYLEKYGFNPYYGWISEMMIDYFDEKEIEEDIIDCIYEELCVDGELMHHIVESIADDLDRKFNDARFRYRVFRKNHYMLYEENLITGDINTRIPFKSGYHETINAKKICGLNDMSMSTMYDFIHSKDTTLKDYVRKVSREQCMGKYPYHGVDWGKRK